MNTMCLAMPGKILSIDNEKARVDFMGVVREVNISLANCELQKNDYVLVHAGFVIEKLIEKDAQASIKRYAEISKFIG